MKTIVEVLEQTSSPCSHSYRAVPMPFYLVASEQLPRQTAQVRSLVVVTSLHSLPPGSAVEGTNV